MRNKLFDITIAILENFQRWLALKFANTFLKMNHLVAINENESGIIHIAT